MEGIRKAAYLQLTRKCNNECIFCSNPQFEKDYSLSEAKETVHHFKNEGVTEIMLTGGEPTLAPFLLDVIRYIKQDCMNPKMITNGVRLSEKGYVQSLYDAGLQDINVSIHSCNEAVADKLSAKEGHLRKALQGVRKALDKGMNVTINSTINSMNCKHLSDNARFFISMFPEVKHYVFNNLDPGNADGNMQSRAGKNSWIIAKLTDMELELKNMADILKDNDKTFRIERVPLCYMQGFEEFSTETRKIVKDEDYMCSFIEKDKKNELRVVKPGQLRRKVEICNHCSLKAICAGVQNEYIDLYGDKELFPVFIDPDRIIDKIRNG